MKIAIVGATGEVGRMMIKSLQEEDIKYSLLDLYASKRSKGKKITIENKFHIVFELTKENIKKNYDYILFSAGSEISKEFVPPAANNGSTVIDNSSAFRRNPEIPLIVPEINGRKIKNYKGIIANPNCSTIQMVLAINKLNQYFEIEEIVVSTYQAVSGAGFKGINELENQRRKQTKPRTFEKQIDLNVIPKIGKIQNDNYCYEEEKMIFETKKIFDNPKLKISATTVRVPVIYGHSESIHIKFNKQIDLKKIEHILENTESVKYTKNRIVTPIDVKNSNQSHVCRLRYGVDKNSIVFWNVANNVRVGAAVNAIRILKLLEKTKKYRS